MIAGAQEAISMSNGGAIANVAILDSRDGAIVIDTGPSKRYGEALKSLARKLTGKPVVRAFITHFHPDHALGNQAFTADALATTADVRKGLEQMGDDFASAMYRTAGDWMRGTEVVLPKTTVAKGVEEIGGRRLHLIPLSGHTRLRSSYSRREIRLGILGRYRVSRSRADDAARGSAALADEPRRAFANPARQADTGARAG